MDGNSPWTDMEMRVLIRCSREILPEIAQAMRRPLSEVITKFTQLHEIFEKQFEEKAQRYIKLGFEPDEAFLKVADEEEIDFERIREIEERA
jgi:hypothetical protein